MTNFFDHFKQESTQLTNNFGDHDDRVDYPSVKAETVFLSKKTPQHVVRFLPSLDMLQGRSFEFATHIRKIFFKNPIAGVKPEKINLRLAPQPDVNSELEQCLVRWSDQGLLQGMFGTVKPTSSFMVYVIPYVPDASNNYVPVVDDDGYPKVQVLEMPKSAYQALVAKLSDPKLAPRNAQGESEDLSFLSLHSSYLTSVTKANQGEQAHKVEIYANIPLGDITGQVEHKLEDLSVLQYTTEGLNPGLVEHIMSTIDQRPRRDGKGGNNAPQTPAPQVPSYQAPSAPVQQAPQAPVTPVQQVPVAPSAPVTPSYQAPSAPVQQAPSAPVPQAPVTPSYQAPVAPVQQAPSAPVPQAPVAPSVPTPQAPVAPSAPTPASSDVSDLMADLQKSLHQ